MVSRIGYSVVVSIVCVVVDVVVVVVVVVVVGGIVTKGVVKEVKICLVVIPRYIFLRLWTSFSLLSVVSRTPVVTVGDFTLFFGFFFTRYLLCDVIIGMDGNLM